MFACCCADVSDQDERSLVHKVLNKVDLESQLQNAGDKLVLVDFYANWCPPCKQIAPVLDKISQTNSEHLIILKVDVDVNKELAREYDISGIPTIVFFKNGQKIDSMEGADKHQLRMLITKHGA